MDVTRFRLKNEAFEIELEGEREWVEQQLNRWLPGMIGEPLPSPKEESEDPPVLRVRRRIDLVDFLALKQPASSVEHLLALAYFIERYEGKVEYFAEELAERWPAEAATAWDQELIDRCLASGYLEEKESGAFTLTFTGEQYVQGGF